MLELTKRYSDYHADLLSQAVLVELLIDGDYDAHLNRLRRTYKARMRSTTRALREHLPTEVRFRAPRGGYKLWLELPPGVGARQIAERARRRGVLVLDGAPFFEASERGDRYLRMSISRTKSARKINAPFSTPNNNGRFPA